MGDTIHPVTETPRNLFPVEFLYFIHIKVEKEMKLHNRKNSHWEVKVYNLSDAEIIEYNDILRDDAFYRKVICYREDDPRDREFVFFVACSPCHIIRASYMTRIGQNRKAREVLAPCTEEDMKDTLAYICLHWQGENQKRTTYSINKWRLIELAHDPKVEVVM